MKLPRRLTVVALGTAVALAGSAALAPQASARMSVSPSFLRFSAGLLALFPWLISHPGMARTDRFFRLRPATPGISPAAR